MSISGETLISSDFVSVANMSLRSLMRLCLPAS
jgi:hypothetical protein